MSYSDKKAADGTLFLADLTERDVTADCSPKCFLQIADFFNQRILDQYFSLKTAVFSPSKDLSHLIGPETVASSPRIYILRQPACQNIA